MSAIPTIKEDIKTSGPIGLGNDAILQAGSTFDAIKGVGGITVDGATFENVTRNNIVLNECNNLIPQLFDELEQHVLRLATIAANVSTESIKIKDVTADFEFDGDTEVVKQFVRTEGDDGEINIELAIESKPVKLKDWKGVSMDKVLTTTSIIDNNETI